jgi:hypothetical protein
MFYIIISYFVAVIFVGLAAEASSAPSTTTPTANQFNLKILTDSYSSIDNAWTLYLISASRPTLIASKAVGAYGNNLLYSEDYILSDGKYQFNLTDLHGDGLINPASYTLSLGGIVLKNGGVFKFLDSTTFNVTTAPPAPAPAKSTPRPDITTLMPVNLAPKPDVHMQSVAKLVPVKPALAPTKLVPGKPALAPTKPAPNQNKPAAPVRPQKLFDRYLVIVLENKHYDDVMKVPYFQNLASKGTLFTSFFALTHPSYPNYIGMVAGSYFGINSNTQVKLQQKSIADLLEAKGLSWKNYAEDYPGNCYLRNSNSNGTYTRKHVPFLSFQSVQDKANRCKNIVPGYTFQDDWKSRRLPNYSFYSPNNNNNGHDSSVAYSASWLKAFLDPLLADSVGMKGTLIQITYDEALPVTKQNKIYNLLIGPVVKENRTVSNTYDHYSMLRSVEYNFDLGTLGRMDSTASIIQELWA